MTPSGLSVIGAMSRAAFSSDLFEKEVHGCTVMGVRELLPPQRLAAEALLDGKGVLVCLPKGYGKSLTFQILPSICSRRRVTAFPIAPIVAVVSPLIALLRNQVESLRAKRLRDGMIGESHSVAQQIREGQLTFVCLVGNPSWRGIEDTSVSTRRS